MLNTLRTRLSLWIIRAKWAPQNCFHVASTPWVNMYTLKIYLPVKPNFTTMVSAGEWKIRWMNPWGFSSGGFSILIPGELGNSESSDGNQPVRNRQPSTPKGFLWLTYSVWDDGHWSLLPSMNWFLKTIHPWLYANKLESWSPLCRIRLLSCQPPSMAYIVDTHKHWFQLTPLTHSLTGHHPH